MRRCERSLQSELITRNSPNEMLSRKNTALPSPLQPTSRTFAGFWISNQRFQVRTNDTLPLGRRIYENNFFSKRRPLDQHRWGSYTFCSLRFLFAFLHFTLQRTILRVAANRIDEADKSLICLRHPAKKGRKNRNICTDSQAINNQNVRMVFCYGHSLDL